MIKCHSGFLPPIFLFLLLTFTSPEAMPFGHANQGERRRRRRKPFSLCPWPVKLRRIPSSLLPLSRPLPLSLLLSCAEQKRLLSVPFLKSGTAGMSGEACYRVDKQYLQEKHFCLVSGWTLPRTNRKIALDKVLLSHPVA